MNFNSFCKYKNIWPKSNVWQRKMKNKVALFNETKEKRVYLCKRHQKSQYFWCLMSLREKRYGYFTITFLSFTMYAPRLICGACVAPRETVLPLMVNTSRQHRQWCCRLRKRGILRCGRCCSLRLSRWHREPQLRKWCPIRKVRFVVSAYYIGDRLYALHEWWPDSEFNLNTLSKMVGSNYKRLKGDWFACILHRRYKTNCISE